MVPWKWSTFFLVLSSASWIAFVVGFGMRSNWNADAGAVREEMTESYLCWWLFACACPVSMLALFFYSIRTTDAVGVIALFVTVLVIAAAGGVMNADVNLIYNHKTGDSNVYTNFVTIEAVGAAAYVLIQAVHLPFVFAVVTKRVNSRYMSSL